MVVQTFNLSVFTNITKQICIFSFISIILIILFVISPLRNLNKTSIFMKFLVLIIIFYTIYLNVLQTKSLKYATKNDSNSDNIKLQLKINIYCTYIFTFFLAILSIFVIKSYF